MEFFNIKNYKKVVFFVGFLVFFSINSFANDYGVSEIKYNEINKKVDEIINKNKEINSFNLSEIVFLEKKKLDNENKYLEIKKSIEKILMIC